MYVLNISRILPGDILVFIAAIYGLEPQVVLGISEYFQDVEHIVTLPIVENAAG